MKIGRWIQRFKDIGDIVVQYDPGHAALPWAGFRFLLQLCWISRKTVDAILVDLRRVSASPIGARSTSISI
ncbi:hypothetical protein BZA05DRAFT_242392 [Tricharina praecox]|uniref:uncharacterized protein n=1 Tax=Tricharina praecox TaxID=43433 RepID=UPI00221E9DEF|nr:uncharacterized protein BZA05DRAFT_242392 [Tricharina praecox]KAI5840895.1 hypothetical protein BZA05DRAFT_242392 [Tricharina praecox]